MCYRNSILAFDVEGDFDAHTICLTIFAGEEFATVYIDTGKEGIKKLELYKSFLRKKILLVWDQNLEKKFIPHDAWVVDCQLPKQNSEIL